MGSGDQSATIAWLFENSHVLLCVIDVDRRLALVNPAWTSIVGWSVEALSGRRLPEILHPDDAGMLETFLRGLQVGKAAEARVRIAQKAGGWRWLEGRFQLAEDGRVLGSWRDATDLRAGERELEDARRTQRLLSEYAGIGRWSHEPDENRIIWSDDFLSLTGYEQDEVRTAQDFHAKLHPDERDAVRDAFRNAFTDGKPQTLEHRLLTKDGAWTTWRATFHAETRPSGKLALKGVSQNITELAEARDAALLGEQRARRLIEAAPFAVAMFDRELRYMVVSPRWRHAFGLGAEDHIGRRLHEVFPDIPKRLLAGARRAAKGESVARPEDRFKDRLGVDHWIRWEAHPWREPSGKVGGILAYIDDVSPLARAREEAKANSQRLKLALEAGGAGVYEIDHVAGTFWASPELRRLAGDRTRCTFENARTLRYPTFHPDDLATVRDDFLAIGEGKRKSGDAFEARIIGQDGEARWVRVFHHLKMDRKGRWLKGVGLVLDIDERKRQELALIEAERAAQAAAEAKAAFLANMSHEIRTPMNGVMGVLHLLKGETLSEDGRRMLDDALSCGQMLAELLNDVIDFSKIEAGHLELSQEPMDPAAVAESVMRLLTPQAEAKNLTLTVQTGAEVGWVKSDPVRLRQALFNLVGNAVKFTLRGGVTLTSRARQVDGRQVLRFEVADTGVGIPLEVQPRIFQRFDQGDASTTRRFGGSGLGLSITKRLAEMMGGDVGFTSEPGRGSTFWLEIAAEPAQAQAAAVEASEGCLDGLRILVVEDNATNRMIATKLLENLGASVETAADGLLGVEAAGRGGFDLILMDVQMPGIDGLEATRRVRALPGAAAGTPIVALTANVLAHQRDTYLAAGMDGVVGKPISPSALLTEIARLSEAAVTEAAA